MALASNWSALREGYVRFRVNDHYSWTYRRAARLKDRLMGFDMYLRFDAWHWRRGWEGLYLRARASDMIFIDATKIEVER